MIVCLTGLWLEEAGFLLGQPYEIEVARGKLVLRTVRGRQPWRGATAGAPPCSIAVRSEGVFFVLMVREPRIGRDSSEDLPTGGVVTDHDQFFKNLLQGYAMQLWLEHERPVVPIVVFMKGGKPDVTREEVRIEVFGHRFLSFWFLAFGLKRSQPARYLARPEPLAWGLAALMREGAPTRARHRIACLEPVVKADLTDRQRYLLVNCAESYIELDQTAWEEYEALLAEKGNEEVAMMEMTWAGRIAHEARESALQEGREEGKRDLLLEQLERRFGPLSQTTVKRVRGLTSSEELSRLAARVLDAPSLEDLGL